MRKLNMKIIESQSKLIFVFVRAKSHFVFEEKKIFLKIIFVL